ncbi:ATP-binding cassette, subfamily B [Sporobacter termitidis DSM 10068]|uniref:ATP-binding cassette, subfamily B n=1 Tax=Sporobacter termitidis DSM 10068 TaxID=1123282 RepID=A0A1M5UDA8_9FIRM|nr:ABC transporter ATP-binding protein [Sporobacter termitidis]SHH60888.1 ATP-binding cassette, subfamily B [Sporobacter termitidis DSM 10068]
MAFSKRKLVVQLAIKIIGTFTDLLLPLILSYIIDDIVPMKRVELVLLWGGAMIACAFVSLFGTIRANRLASEISRDTTEAMRRDLFAGAMRLSRRQMDRFTAPSIVARLTSDTYNIHNTISTVLRLGIRTPVLLLGGIIMAFILEPVLTLILLATLPVILALVVIVSNKGIPMYSKLQQTVDRLVRAVRESTSGIRVIKALSKTEHEKARFEKVNQELREREQRAGVLMSVTSPVMNIILNVGLVLVILAGAYRVNMGLSQPGKLLAFMTYFTIILNAMLWITRVFIMISRASASGDRIGEVVNAPEERRLAAPDHMDSDYHVSFDNVSFSYNKVKNNVENISFHLKKGETLGIIGPTGSGKSTILQLLLRFYEPDAGTIRIGGEKIDGIENLSEKFGVVFQNDVLFEDTIENNIIFGRSLGAAEALMAAENAQAGEFIAGFPDGLGHMLSVRGQNLSGGQKQRLLIARALASSPEILILDDAASALDYKTDAALRHVLKTAYRDTTTLIVAQRVSSIMYADHILVLEDGAVVGSGVHEELLKSCDSYRLIAELQMGGGRRG